MFIPDAHGKYLLTDHIQNKSWVEIKRARYTSVVHFNVYKWCYTSCRKKRGGLVIKDLFSILTMYKFKYIYIFY